MEIYVLQAIRKVQLTLDHKVEELRAMDSEHSLSDHQLDKLRHSLHCLVDRVVEAIQEKIRANSDPLASLK